MIQTRLSLDRGKLFVLFVDFRSAFPSDRHNLLWKKLFKLGTESKMINLLKIFMEKPVSLLETFLALQNKDRSQEGYYRET